MLGLTNPWIWGAYVACFIATAFCIVFGYVRTRGSKEEDDLDE
ncbi:MAG TPA: hypothetical protein VJX93_05750 [Candidatus Methanomethylophilaceae archaeon]|nr:hypothetical protein [Candidatus Methanomethylophilaceae archaeon]